MTSLADRTIVSLRTVHDDLAALVPSLTEEQLHAPSGASDWSVAQVLSHLGSGAVIGLAGYRAALDGSDAPGQDFNTGVWDRWNAMAPAEQATAFLAADEELVAAVEALTPEQRESTQVKLGFLPAPLPMASVLGMRLNEAALHAWDAKVGLEPSAAVDAGAAEVVLEHFSGALGFLLGFTGKADALAGSAVVGLDGTDLSIVIGDSVSLATGVAPTATFEGAPEAAVRLLGGRLAPAYTPEGLSVTGDVTLDELRTVFPGY
ncbi:conserved hypothetical protein [metagenome]|uniref:Mycothiol-dependent maleylpyruvate isomerase metal-binding domain-containing protein n=1 Tax=metagenome TaxID=256318 RepID=A0A2P2C781_9ZZZZ